MDSYQTNTGSPLIECECRKSFGDLNRNFKVRVGHKVKLKPSFAHCLDTFSPEHNHCWFSIGNTIGSFALG